MMRRNLSHSTPQGKFRFEVDVDDNKVVLPRSNFSQSDLGLDKKSNVSQWHPQILVNAKRSRSSHIFIIKKESTKEPKSWSQHLDSLKKLVLPMYFLETNDVVIVQESTEIFELELPVYLRGKNRPKETPSVPSNTSQTSIRELATCIPTCNYAVVLAVVLEEYSVSNGNVWKLEERLVVDRRWELWGESEGLDCSNLAIGSAGQSKDMGPLVSMWWP